MNIKQANFNEAVYKTAKKIAEMLIKKRLDYGNENLKPFGELGILIRVYDKLSRLKNLLYDNPHMLYDNPHRKPKNETVEDTWLDIAGYAILALMMREGTLDLPIKEVVGEND